MCLALVGIDAHPRYRVVLAANRDEYHARAATPARWWAAPGPTILAGRDLVANGTWLGVDRRGRYAFVTNVRDPARFSPVAPTRGTLVPRILAEDGGMADVVRRAVHAGAAMNGFNVLGGDAAGGAWGSNRADEVVVLDRGVHGISNAALDTPWPKLTRTRDALSAWLARASDDPEPLFELLADRTLAAPDALPQTGVAPEWERVLSAPFIVTPGYGTRCTTVVLIGRDHRVRFIERTFDPTGMTTGEVDLAFATTPQAVVSAG